MPDAPHIKVDLDKYLIRPDSKVKLDKYPTDDDGGLDRDAAEARFEHLLDKLCKLQELMYAEGKHALLVVLQAMDAGGKDSTIRKVFGPIDPQGVDVASFKGPTPEELSHDFLWRIHAHVPGKGRIVVFNRSHYEDVLIVRVKNLLPKDRWVKRYDHINDFERLLHDEGTHILKFFLHISKDYQKQRLERRLERADKHWKFNPEDLLERDHWDAYQHAYEVMLEKCGPKHAPWYIIPAERKWYRNLLIAEALVRQLESMKMDWPKAKFDPAQIVVK